MCFYKNKLKEIFTSPVEFAVSAQTPTYLLYYGQRHVRGLVSLASRFSFVYVKHTQMEISIITKRNLAHGVAECMIGP